MRLAIKPKKNQSFVDRYFEQKQDQTFRILVSERLHQTFLEHSFPMMKLEMITTIFVSKRKMEAKLNIWLSHDLTLFGRIAIFLGLSQFIYTSSMLSVPETVILQTQKKLFAFLWKSKTDQIKRLFFSSHYPKVD